MKFSKFGQASLIAAAALLVATAFTACSPVTIDYLYVVGNRQSPGQIQTFEIDRQTGALTIVGSSVSSGGVNPVAAVAHPYGRALYVVNQGDNTLVQFAVGGTGVPSAPVVTSLTASGNSPVAMAINATGSLLYVVTKYQPGCSTAVVGASSCNGGALAVYPISSAGVVGTAVTNGGKSYLPVGINPTAVNALADGSGVLVSSYDPAAGLGYLYSFTATSAGALATASGSPYPAGVRPSGITSTQTTRYVYVTDFAQNEMIGYSILGGATLRPLLNGPFRTGNQPTAITIDPRGSFLYLTNELDNSISAYEINLQNGTPAGAINPTGSATNSTGTLPVSVLVDPGFGRYVFSANFLDNSVTSFQLNPSTGTLSATQGGPFPTVGQPVAIAAIPRGNHSVQTVQP